MNIDERLLQHYDIDEQQEAIISHSQGPLRVIAGPGSGKTHSLVLLAMNLLLQEKAKPTELILCTYTEKAAFEMQDRLREVARKVEYSHDISQVRVGTIHSICSKIVEERLHDVAMPLSNGYEALDQLSQRLLIFNHLQEICTPSAFSYFCNRWMTHWGIVKQLQALFDKIAEELIFDQLKQHVRSMSARKNEQDSFLYHLTGAYHSYQQLLSRRHCIDFAHMQKLAYNILKDSQRANHIVKDVRYVLVDEYQDTNYIQEQILVALSSSTGNLCVVGDEDQSIYRFRGATVRNILEFENKHQGCKTIHLTTNYRSHPKITQFCCQWMSSIDWLDAEGKQLRTQKTLESFRNPKHEQYPAVVSLLEVSSDKEAEQFADLVFTLKKRGIISDYNQVALLLRSVRPHESAVYIKALEEKDISAFCTRARTFFDQDEIRLMIGCLAFLFGYVEKKMPDIVGNEEIAIYLRECQEYMTNKCQQYPLLAQKLSALSEEMNNGQLLVNKAVLSQYFYQVLTCEPFVTIYTHEEHIYNLMLFSRLLQTFRTRYASSKEVSLEQLQQQFFNIFLRVLYEDGMNPHEDEQQNFPEGHVPILTVHQAKGLEFPVIVVGRLDTAPFPSSNEDKELRQLYHQSSLEPERFIPRFDAMRHYYVAFTRAQHLLVLSSAKKPNSYIAPFVQNQALPQWVYVQGEFHTSLRFHAKQRIPLKPRLGFTSHIKTYETCPRRYQYFHLYNFAPSHVGDFFLGQLVHHSIENIHRIARDGHFDRLNPDIIRQICEKVAASLAQKYDHFEDDGSKEKALKQVMNYFLQNSQEIRHVESAEVAISVEKEQYVLTGKVDLLVRVNEKLHLFDFKTEHRPEKSTERLTSYKRQLLTYAHIIGQHQELPERLFIYWTGEGRKEDAVMEIRYHPEEAEVAGRHFDETVSCILQQEFDATPHPVVCTKCDLRNLCAKEGLLEQIN